MIHINLLPEGVAQPGRTPMSLFLVIIGDVVLGMLAVLAFIYFHFVSLRDVESRKAQAEQELTPLRRYSLEHQQLTQLKTKYATRNEQISTLERTRLSWARKFYEFSKVLEGPKDGEKHPIWIENWEPSEPRAAQPARGAKGAAAPSAPSYEIKMTVHVARPSREGPEGIPIEHYLTGFRRDLTDVKQFPFWADFLSGDQGITFPDLTPDPKGAFAYFEESQFGVSNVTLRMKPLDWRFEPLPKPAAKTPARPGR